MGARSSKRFKNAPTTSNAVNVRNRAKSISSPRNAYPSIQSSNTSIVALIASSAFSTAEVAYAGFTSRDMSIFSAGSVSDMGVRKRQSGKRRALYQSPLRCGVRSSFLGPSAWAMLISLGAMRTKGPWDGEGVCQQAGPKACESYSWD